ncbi:substrate-binding domain-containing protein [Acetobacteraceae bacterium KSS8]|uniref:Substrate-binding domain-containing protein n=1 Tax=Endosaccharibacter trunci TaxID=2812733 RepID=A0ABT1W6R0_9PROT|nr:substrate-binding domain-containing protein [Acetobacteraceae bacterium KSS8]
MIRHAAPALLAAAILSALPCVPAARAADVVVMASGGMAASLRALAPDFARSGDHLVLVRGPSMGATSDAIPARLARGERCDVVAMVGGALDGLHAKGLVGAGTVMAMSPIGVVVRAGAPHPAIGTPDALRRTLLDAPSVAFSDSASGVYVSHDLFRRLGIEDQMRDKARMIPETPVAQIVAGGGAAIGFQQISEILPVKGAELVGPIPQSLQKLTPFAVAPCRDAPDPAGGRAFIRFLSSGTAREAMRSSGLDPVGRATP